MFLSMCNCIYCVTPECSAKECYNTENRERWFWPESDWSSRLSLGCGTSCSSVHLVLMCSRRTFRSIMLLISFWLPPVLLITWTKHFTSKTSHYLNKTPYIKNQSFFVVDSFHQIIFISQIIFFPPGKQAATEHCHWILTRLWSSHLRLTCILKWVFICCNALKILWWSYQAGASLGCPLSSFYIHQAKEARWKTSHALFIMLHGKTFYNLWGWIRNPHNSFANRKSSDRFITANNN